MSSRASPPPPPSWLKRKDWFCCCVSKHSPFRSVHTQERTVLLIDGVRNAVWMIDGVCFWASRNRIRTCLSDIRIRILLRIRIPLPSSKNRKKTLDFPSNWFVTSVCFLYASAGSKSPLKGPVWRIRDVYPGSRILIFTHPGSRISEPGSKNSNKRQVWKFFFCQTIFCSHNFHKTEYYLFLIFWRKKFGPIFQELLKFYPKNCHQALKNMCLRSRIRKKPIPDPGSRIQGSKRHRISDPGSGSAILVWSLKRVTERF